MKLYLLATAVLCTCYVGAEITNDVPTADSQDDINLHNNNQNKSYGQDVVAVEERMEKDKEQWYGKIIMEKLRKENPTAYYAHIRAAKLIAEEKAANEKNKREEEAANEENERGEEASKEEKGREEKESKEEKEREEKASKEKNEREEKVSKEENEQEGEASKEQNEPEEEVSKEQNEPEEEVSKEQNEPEEKSTKESKGTVKKELEVNTSNLTRPTTQRSVTRKPTSIRATTASISTSEPRTEITTATATGASRNIEPIETVLERENKSLDILKQNLKTITPNPYSTVKPSPQLQIDQPTLNPKPVTVRSKPTTVKPIPVTVRSKPTTMKPIPVTVRSKPTTMKPIPVTVRSKPTTMKPIPVTVRSKPTTIKPIPVIVRSKPTTMKPIPVTVRSKPTTIKPIPVTIRSKPTTMKPTPETVRSKLVTVKSTLAHQEDDEGEDEEEDNDVEFEEGKTIIRASNKTTITDFNSTKEAKRYHETIKDILERRSRCLENVRAEFPKLKTVEPDLESTFKPKQANVRSQPITVTSTLEPRLKEYVVEKDDEENYEEDDEEEDDEVAINEKGKTTTIKTHYATSFATTTPIATTTTRAESRDRFTTTTPIATNTTKAESRDRFTTTTPIATTTTKAESRDRFTTTTPIATTTTKAESRGRKIVHDILERRNRCLDLVRKGFANNSPLASKLQTDQAGGPVLTNTINTVGGSQAVNNQNGSCHQNES